MCWILIGQMSLKSSERVELEFLGLKILIILYFKSQGTEKYELFSQGTYNIQNLSNKTFSIPDHERVNISKFADLGIDY